MLFFDGHLSLQVFEQLDMVKLLQDNRNTLGASYSAINATQTDQAQPTVHNCAAANYTWWKWQVLKTPNLGANVTTGFTAEMIHRKWLTPGTPFPPTSYGVLNGSNVSAPFFRGQAATIARATLRSTEVARTNGSLLEGLDGPPAARSQSDDQKVAFRRAMQEVLQVSASLDDRKKVIAECECQECLWTACCAL